MSDTKKVRAGESLAAAVARHYGERAKAATYPNEFDKADFVGALEDANGYVWAVYVPPLPKVPCDYCGTPDDLEDVEWQGEKKKFCPECIRNSGASKR